MPFLFSVGQHSSLDGVRAQLKNKKTVAFFSLMTSTWSRDQHPDCLGDKLQTKASIPIHGGKTKIWNQAGERPPVWRCSEVPTAQQGITVLGTFQGHPDFVRQHSRDVFEEHEWFPTRTSLVKDVQSALFLLLHCAQARANFLLRAVKPEAVEEFAARHDRSSWWCLAQILGVNVKQCDVGMQEAATLPLVLGGLGLRNAIRTRYFAFWASLADCTPMVDARHPEVAAQLVVQLEGHPATLCLGAAAAAAKVLTGIMNFEPPSWRSVLLGARRPHRAPDTFQPGTQRQKKQHEASSRIEENFKVALLDRLPDSAKASLRSQGGPGAGLSFTTCSTCLVTRFEPHLFRILLLRLRLPLPFTVRSCRCDLPLDSCGHHRAACAQAGVLGKRGWALESVAVRICREAGGRVTTNVMLRDLDMVLPNAADGRLLEVVADGLPLFGGAQLAVWCVPCAETATPLAMLPMKMVLR